MNTEHDPIEARLRALRHVMWDRVDHQRRLEKRLMQESRGLGAKWWPRFGIVGGLVLAGGVAGATTAAWISHWVVEEEDLPGDMKRVTLTNTQTGESDVSVVPDDSAMFIIEGDPETVLTVQHAPDGPPEVETPAETPQEPRKD